MSDCSEDDYSESPSPKRQRGENFGNNMGEISAELQLQEMLLAVSRPSVGLLSAEQQDHLRQRYQDAENTARGKPAVERPPPGMPWMPGGKGCGKGGMGLAGLGLTGATGPADLINEPKVATTMMDFSKLAAREAPSMVEVQRPLVGTLMTSENRQLLAEESGAHVEWAPEDAKVLLSGSVDQTKKAERVLARVMMHCRWGHSAAKVRRLLKPSKVESVVCRLSPMAALKPAQKTLSRGTSIMTIGKDKHNDAVINDALISRQHCVLELDEDRGAVYVIDCSTNGCFLNGLRLPTKSLGKVILSHGDELLFKDPASGDAEFGYIVNLNELVVKAEMTLTAPRRLLGPDDMAIGRDFG